MKNLASKKKRMSKLMIIATLFSLFSMGNVYACEKWKSEIAWAVVDVGKYISNYQKFDRGDISRETFKEKSSELIEKLTKIRDRVENVASCTDEAKFEDRRQALLSTLNAAIPIMNAGSALAASFKEDLKRHDN